MKAKLGAIFLVSVLAIAGAGATYAMWFERLDIWTDIITGEVDVEWSEGWYEDDETKNVSEGGMYIDANDPNLMHFWVECAYPCINYTWYFDVHSVGCVPVHFTPFYVHASNTATEDMVVQEDTEILCTGITKADGTEIVFDPPRVLWDQQLHQGDTAWCYFNIHFNNELPENSDLTYDMHMFAYQYNEEW